MNRIISLILAAVVCLGCQTQKEEIQIDCTPVSFDGNEAFMRVCLDKYDQDGDGVLTVHECSLVKEMDVSGYNLFSLKGIENFTCLETLFCYGNVLSTLDLSSLVNLKYLYCNNSNVHSLDVSGCRNLLILDAHYNFLKELDVTGCPEIFLLSVCFNPDLDDLDLSSSSRIGTLYCQSCSLKSLDLSSCPRLAGLHCWGNKLTELNLTGCSDLMDLWCGDNDLSSIDLTSCPDKMQYISCPRNPRLTKVYMRNGQTASSIELSALTAIIYKP